MSESIDHEIQVLRASFWSKRDPEGRAFASLAAAYQRNGELEEAHALVQEGLRRHPDFASGHLVAAWVARDKGDHVLAREHLDRVLDLDVSNVRGLIERAGTAASEGDRDGAVGDLQTVLVQDPSHREARERLEAIELGSVWEPEATDIQEPELPPVGGSMITRTMGELYARQGFRDRAVEVFETLLEWDGENEVIAKRLAELKSSGDEAEGSGPEESQDAEEEIRGSKDGAEPTPRTTSFYLDDLLAWVPDAVPIAPLAPDVELYAEPGVTEMPAPLAAQSDTGEETPEEGLDDFNRWVRSLQP